MDELKEKLNQLLDALSRLSPREQLAVGVGVVVFIVMIVSIVGFSIKSSIATRERRITSLRSGVQEIAKMETTFQAAEKRKEAFVKQLEDNTINLRMKVGTIATEQNITIESITESGGSMGGKSSFTEEAIKVQVRRIGFVEMFEFFRRIESVSDLMYLREVQMRRRYDNAELLDVTFTVATIKAKEI